MHGKVVLAMAMDGTRCLWGCVLQLQRISYSGLQWIDVAFSYFSDVVRLVPVRSTNSLLS